MITKLTDQLWISGAEDLQHIEPDMFDVIVNVAHGWSDYETFKHLRNGPLLLQFDMWDHDYEEVQTPVIKVAVTNILNQLRIGKKVLVHCIGGTSRSVVTCMAVLRKLEGFDWVEAETFITSKHGPAFLLNRKLLDVTKEEW